MKLTYLFTALLVLALVACGVPTTPESSGSQSETYGKTHEGEAAIGRNELEE
jgi:hypothetical protein